MRVIVVMSSYPFVWARIVRTKSGRSSLSEADPPLLAVVKRTPAPSTPPGQRAARTTHLHLSLSPVGAGSGPRRVESPVAGRYRKVTPTSGPKVDHNDHAVAVTLQEDYIEF